MKNHLKNFWNRATLEDGASLEGRDFSDGYAGLIYFSEDHWIDCSITIDEVKIYDSYLDANHEYMFDAFTEFVQAEIRKSEASWKDQQETQRSLMYA